MRLYDQKNNLKIAALAIFSLGLIPSLLEDASSEEEIFPLWLKDIAVWWGEDQITDQDFVTTLQYLVDKKILVIPDREIEKPDCGPALILNATNDCVIHDKTDTTGIFVDAIDEQQKIVLSWIKVTTLWWGQDKIGDQDFMSALQYLVENNVLTKEPVKEPKPQVQQKPLPSDLIVWPKIDKIEEVKIQGHGDTEYYNLQLKLVDIDKKTVKADGTISIVIVDDRNRILYLDAFSVKKQMTSFGPGNYTKIFETFGDYDGVVDLDDKKETDRKLPKVFAWKIKTSDIKPGFTDSGVAKIVFTDIYGNIFESKIIPISIPQYTN